MNISVLVNDYKMEWLYEACGRGHDVWLEFSKCY